MAERKITKLDHLKKLADKTHAELAALETKIEGKGYQTKTQVESIVNAKVASAYRPAGSVGADHFGTAPSKDDVGKVYNVTETFTTNANFVEGTGKKFPAGTDVAVIDDDGAYKYNVMAGFVDLSSYETTEGVTNKLKDYVTNSALTTKLADYVTDTALTGKLESYVTQEEADEFLTESDLAPYLKESDIASDTEVEQMLKTAFGDTE